MNQTCVRVVALLEAGLSNRQIAARLFLSVRTVEGYIYQACRQVGARSRQELPRLFWAAHQPGRAFRWFSREEGV